jgi:hypothetical protein
MGEDEVYEKGGVCVCVSCCCAASVQVAKKIWPPPYFLILSTFFFKGRWILCAGFINIHAVYESGALR